MNALREQAVSVLKDIAAHLQVDDHKCVWSNEPDSALLGFAWWPGDYCVSIRAHPDLRKDKEGFRLKMETACLRDVDVQSPKFERMIAVLSRFSTSCYALVYTPDEIRKEYKLTDAPTLFFSSTCYITEGNIGWLPKLFANLGIIQPINAQIEAARLAPILGGTPR